MIFVDSLVGFNVGLEVQSATKLFEHLQKYLWFFSGFIAKFYHFMLVIIRSKPNDHDLTIIYFVKVY